MFFGPFVTPSLYMWPQGAPWIGLFTKIGKGRNDTTLKDHYEARVKSPIRGASSAQKIWQKWRIAPVRNSPAMVYKYGGATSCLGYSTVNLTKTKHEISNYVLISIFLYQKKLIFRRIYSWKAPEKFGGEHILINKKLCNKIRFFLI